MRFCICRQFDWSYLFGSSHEPRFTFGDFFTVSSPLVLELRPRIDHYLMNVWTCAVTDHAYLTPNLESNRCQVPTKNAPIVDVWRMLWGSPANNVTNLFTVALSYLHRTCQQSVFETQPPLKTQIHLKILDRMLKSAQRRNQERRSRSENRCAH